jgi:hypothetical protein
MAQLCAMARFGVSDILEEVVKQTTLHACKFMEKTYYVRIPILRQEVCGYHNYEYEIANLMYELNCV